MLFIEITFYMWRIIFQSIVRNMIIVKRKSEMTS